MADIDVYLDDDKMECVHPTLRHLDTELHRSRLWILKLWCQCGADVTQLNCSLTGRDALNLPSNSRADRQHYRDRPTNSTSQRDSLMASYTPDIHGSAATYTPPPPPPKPGTHTHSHDAARIASPTPPTGFTPVTAYGPQGSRNISSPSPPSDSPAGGPGGPYASPPVPQYNSGQAAPFPGPDAGGASQGVDLQDPGDHWLPQILQDKS